VLAAPDTYGLPVDPSTAQIHDIMFGWLTDDPDAKLVLPTPATLAQDEYRFPIEQRERRRDKLGLPCGDRVVSRPVVVDCRSARDTTCSYGFDSGEACWSR
jgi:hypothetical protein